MSAATHLLVRLAADLVVEGLDHPVTAALARGSRMHTLAGPGAFAAVLGVDEFTVRRAESGAMPVDELPAAYLSYLDAIEPSIDLVGLRALALRTDGPPSEAGRDDCYGGADVVDLDVRRAARATPSVQRVC